MDSCQGHSTHILYYISEVLFPLNKILHFSVQSYYTFLRRPKGATALSWEDANRINDDNDEDEYHLHPSAV